ncbi:MAG: hypothetical protein ACRD3T_21420 [Terriglobia bacterium]
MLSSIGPRIDQSVAHSDETGATVFPEEGRLIGSGDHEPTARWLRLLTAFWREGPLVVQFAVAALFLHFVQGRLSAPKLLTIKDGGGDTAATKAPKLRAIKDGGGDTAATRAPKLRTIKDGGGDTAATKRN